MILTLIIRSWNEVFSKFDFLGSTEKNYFFELRQIRNKWAHQLEFNSDGFKKFFIDTKVDQILIVHLIQ